MPQHAEVEAYGVGGRAGAGTAQAAAVQVKTLVLAWALGLRRRPAGGHMRRLWRQLKERATRLASVAGVMAGLFPTGVKKQVLSARALS